MNRPPLSNNGFGVLGILAVIVALVVIGGAGAYVWHRDHKTTTKSTSSTSSRSANTTTKSNTSTSSSSQSPQNDTHTTNEAVSLVQTTYTAALNYVKQTTRADQGEIDAVKGSLSSSLYDQLTSDESNGPGHDLILCGQMRPDSFTVSSGPTANNVATVFVNEIYGTSAVKVTTTVDLAALKLTTISCPQ